MGRKHFNDGDENEQQSYRCGGTCGKRYFTFYSHGMCETCFKASEHYNPRPAAAVDSKDPPCPLCKGEVWRYDSQPYCSKCRQCFDESDGEYTGVYVPLDIYKSYLGLTAEEIQLVLNRCEDDLNHYNGRKGNDTDIPLLINLIKYFKLLLLTR